MTRLGLQNQGRKDTGKSVWELYESGQHEAIKERTASEVENAVRISDRIISKVVSGQIVVR
jgi:hypothetical protein